MTAINLFSPNIICVPGAARYISVSKVLKQAGYQTANGFNGRLTMTQVITNAPLTLVQSLLSGKKYYNELTIKPATANQVEVLKVQTED